MRRKKLQEKSSPEKMPFQQIVKYMIERTRLQIYALGGRWKRYGTCSRKWWCLKIPTAFSSPLHPNIDTIRQWLYRCPPSAPLQYFHRPKTALFSPRVGQQGNFGGKNMGWKWVGPGRGFGRAGPKGHQPLSLSHRGGSSYLNGFMSSMIIQCSNICQTMKETKDSSKRLPHFKRRGKTFFREVYETTIT